MKILNKKLGYTLMEMMIVVVIISLIAVAGIPYYRGHVERQKTASGITTLRAISDSVERYMAMHNETLPTNFSFDLIDAELDPTKLSADHTTYNDGVFTFSVTGGFVTANRNTGSYALSYSLTNSAFSCEPEDYCTNTLNVSCSDL